MDVDKVNKAINALCHGAPKNVDRQYLTEPENTDDHQRTGVSHLVFKYSSTLEDDEFIQALSDEKANWIFYPARIRERMHLILEFGLDKLTLDD